jgi:small subunit ribosomal protein S20
MANHKSSIKRIRSNEAKRLRNKYQHKTTRNAIKQFCELTAKKEAEKSLPTIMSMIDKLAKQNVIHANKASRFVIEKLLHKKKPTNLFVGFFL